MAAEGGFGPEWRAGTAELAYWQLTGGIDAGKATALFDKNDGLRRTVIDDALRAAARADGHEVIEEFVDDGYSGAGSPRA